REPAPGAGPPAARSAAAGRAIAPLRSCAARLLEGQQGASPAGPVRAPLPLYARALLGRLSDGRPPARQMHELCEELASSAGRSPAVSRPHRVGHLAVQGLLAAFGFFVIGLM